MYHCALAPRFCNEKKMWNNNMTPLSGLFLRRHTKTRSNKNNSRMEEKMEWSIEKVQVLLAYYTTNGELLFYYIT